MNKDTLETQWAQIKEAVKAKYSELTDEDIRQINGRWDQLVAKLQQRYNYTKEDAEERLRSWDYDRTTTSRDVRDTRDVRKEEVATKKDDYSPLYWLLGLGIPLLLLAAYLLNTPKETDTTRAPAATNQEAVVEAPADRSVSDVVRRALGSQEEITLKVRNIQVTTHNGVVTLSGVVADREARDQIENTAKRVSGVKQVINNLQVR